MAPPHKGKPLTKGAKQILAENNSTLAFYRNMTLVSIILYVAHNVVLNIYYSESISFWNLVVTFVTITIHVGIYQGMRHISTPMYTDNNQLLDPGLDLNMEGGMGEHIKDFIILMSLTHVLVIFSGYFWLLLLFIPIRAFWLIWTNILGPWFFQEAPIETEQDVKKMKKLERKMRRH